MPQAARQLNTCIHLFWTAIRRPLKQAILSLSLLFSVQATAELSPFSAEYELTRGTFPIAQLKLSLQHHKSGFLLESKTEPVAPLSWVREAIVIEKSYWHYHNHFPRPSRYLYSRSNRNKLHKVALDFDWRTQTLTTTTNGDAWEIALTDQTLDKALVQLALMEDLSQGKTQNSYLVADGGKPKTYRFTQVGNETVDSKLGRTKTVRINRSKSGKESRTTLWMAPKFNYLPIKINKVREGITYTLSLTKLTTGQK